MKFTESFVTNPIPERDISEGELIVLCLEKM
jgi:hypothetical protein